MRIENRLSISCKRRFILFTQAVHQLLIGEGSTSIKCLGYIQDGKELSITGRGLKGFAIKKNTSRQFDENGKLTPIYDQQIWKYHLIPDDPNDPIRIDFLRANPHLRMKDTTCLKGKAKKIAECYNKRSFGTMEIAPHNVKITEAEIEYPIHSDRLKEMYNHHPKFYLYLGIGYNKDYFRKSGYKLFKKLQACQNKRPRILNITKYK